MPAIQKPLGATAYPGGFREDSAREAHASILAPVRLYNPQPVFMLAEWGHVITLWPAYGVANGCAECVQGRLTCKVVVAVAAEIYEAG